MLTLHEELFLMAINDDKGFVTWSSSSEVDYGLAGAILAELTLQGKLHCEKDRLVVMEAMPTADECLNLALETITTSPKLRKATHWISTLGGKNLAKRVAKGLVAKGVLRLEEKRFLWVIPYEASLKQDTSAKYWVKQQLRAMVLGGEKPEPRTIALLSLLKACNLLSLVFTKDERKAAEKKVEALAEDELFGNALVLTLEEIEMITAATMVVITAAS